MGLCSAGAAGADLPRGLPGANGLPTEAFTAPLVVGGQRVVVRLQRPIGWATHTDERSIRIEPEPNPGDVGLIVLVTVGNEALAAASADALPALLQPVLLEPTVVRRDEVSLATSDGGSMPAVLLHLEAQFETHRRGQFIALYATAGPVVIMALAGASEDVFGPFDAALRDLLLSVQLEPLVGGQSPR